MHPDKFHELMAKYTEGVASAEEVHRLNALFAVDAAARRQFLELCNLDSALEMESVDHVPEVRPCRPGRVWLPWPSAAAMLLIGICGAMLGVSAAWAVVPQIRDIARRSILRSSFENVGEVRLRSHEPRLTRRMPGFRDAWEADDVRITGAENGVAPFLGNRMLSFEKAVGPAFFDAGEPHSCDLYRIVDLSPFQSDISSGISSLMLSARFCDASPPHEEPTLFELRIHIFSKPPDEVADFSKGRSALVSNVIRTFGDDSGRPWRRLVASATVPSNAVFAVVQISATRPAQAAQPGPAVFSRHYCDDIELSFATDANPQR